MGKPLRSILHMNPNIPIYIGAGTETNTRLCGEVCDGLLPLRFVPSQWSVIRPWIEEGRRRAGKSLEGFAIQASADVRITDDIPSALRPVKQNVALYVGGMGHRDKNFHKDMMIRRGYPEAAETIQELFLSGRKAEAVEAVPDEFCDEMGLFGSPARIRQRYKAWADSGITALTVRTDQPEAMELMAELARD